MYVINVIPLARATMLESLSYYSSLSYQTGTIIRVPVRQKIISAVVVESSPVSAAKAALRAATFSLKKLSPQPDAPLLPTAIIKTAETLLKETPAQLGNIIFNFLPPEIRAGERPYPFTKEYVNEEDSIPSVLTDTSHGRFLTYRSIIRQTFAHNGSVLFVVPTAAAVLHSQELLKKGIEKRIVTFSSSHTKKQIETAYTDFIDFSNAKLIITTPSYALLDRHDITTIIIDEAGSSHYKARTRPYLDTRVVLRHYATVTKRTLLYGDSLPRTEEEYQRRSEHYQTSHEHPHRHNFASVFNLAPHGNQNPTERTSFIFTDELRETITRTLNNKGNVFLLASRRGLASLITCYDCGYVFRCPDSGAPYSLIATGEGQREERWFYSATSGRKVRAADVCPQCSSWRLKELGIGLQQVARETRKFFEAIPLLTFDSTTVTSARKASQILERFYSGKGNILIGTPMALPYLNDPIALTAVISYEAMRNTPTWRAEENTFRTLLRLRELTSGELVVQTRNEPDPLLKYISRGLIDDFYSEEIAMRQALSYPPFATFVLFTWQGNTEQVKKLEEILHKALPNYDVQFYNQPLTTDKIIRHGLLRVKALDWPDSKLMDILRSLPPMIKIEVSPERIV